MPDLALSRQAPSLAAIYRTPPELDPESFRALVHLAKQACGIALTQTKRTMLETRLRRRLAINGLNSFRDYVELLASRAGRESEFQSFTDCIVTNQTSFFREAPHFDYLTPQVLVELAAGGDEPSLRIWSAAASSGQEAYSLAMIADEASQGNRIFPWSVLATDISSRMLTAAQEGAYTLQEAAAVPARLRHYLQPVAGNGGTRVRVVPELRRGLRIGWINLMHQRYMPGKTMDIVFCRNVLIYFDPSVQVEIIAKLSAHLRPGGLMVLGHSESLRAPSLPLRPIHRNIYVRL